MRKNKMNFERVKKMLEILSGNHFMKRRVIEQLLYNAMVGEGDGLYHVLMGDVRTSYVWEFIGLLIKVSGRDNVRRLDYDEMLARRRFIRDTDKLVIGLRMKRSDITDRDEAVLRYLVDNEPMYIKPAFPYESGRTLCFGGIVVQRGSDSFIDSLSAGLRRRVSLLQFGYVAEKDYFDFNIDDDMVEELKSYLQVRYGS